MDSPNNSLYILFNMLQQHGYCVIYSFEAFKMKPPLSRSVYLSGRTFLLEFMSQFLCLPSGCDHTTIAIIVVH